MNTQAKKLQETNTIPGRFIPGDAQIIQWEDIIIYTYENTDGKPLAVGYGGKRKKSDFHYSFKNEENRTIFIDKHLETKKNSKAAADAAKAKKKADAEKAIAELKVGDIFHCGWGYEQTQCDFYQLVDLKGKTGTFRPVYAETVPGSEGHDCDRRVARVDEFIGDEFKKRLNGDTFKISSFQYVSKCEPTKSFYCSWYY